MVIDNDKEAKYIRGKKGFWCKKTLKLGHTDITTIDKVCDKYGKGKFVQMEALSARYSFINGKMVPTVQT
ncbi:hypothetical protein [Bacillus cereus]|uniref:hypothetical protein n=1 Tax=Bacillus cereus TaxID=1396 RepID=UPI001C2C25AE|nr:hypothetical protein [Bacillus cereus]